MTKQTPTPKQLKALETIARMLREDMGSLCQSQAVSNGILTEDMDVRGPDVMVGIRCRATKRMHQMLTLREEDMQEPATLLYRARQWAESLRHGICSMCPLKDQK